MAVEWTTEHMLINNLTSSIDSLFFKFIFSIIKKEEIIHLPMDDVSEGDDTFLRRFAEGGGRGVFNQVLEGYLLPGWRFFFVKFLCSGGIGLTGHSMLVTMETVLCNVHVLRNVASCCLI